MIMSSLYFGNIQPSEDAVSGDPRYRELNEDVLAALKELEGKLSGEEMELLDRFHGCINQRNSYECEAVFRFGLSLGILLMQEANMTIQFSED